jgi:hypothetical protein
MIDHVLSHVVSELNDYFNARVQVPDRVLATSLFHLNGEVNNDATDKVVVSIINVREDGSYPSVRTFEKRSDGTAEQVLPPVRVNLYLLFVANMKVYKEAARALGHVMSFFQHRPSFDYASISALADHEGRFSAELESMTFEQLNHLWGVLGGKYVPSVLYKLGLLDVRDRQVRAEVAPVTRVGVTAEA